MYYLYNIEVDGKNIIYPYRLIYKHPVLTVIFYSKSVRDYTKYYVEDMETCILTFIELESKGVWTVSIKEFFESKFDCKNIYSCKNSDYIFSCYIFNRCIGIFNRCTDLRSLRFTHNVKDIVYGVFSDLLININWWKYRVNSKNILYFKDRHNELKVPLTEDFSKLETGLLKCKMLEKPNRILDTRNI